MNILRALLLLSVGVPFFAVMGAGPIPYAPAPNDTYFPELWYLENLETNTVRRGFDVNARSAWSLSRGAGVTIAIVDNGVDLGHPDLTHQAAPSLHWNFDANTAHGDHPTDFFTHGTPVAGLANAEGRNQRGVIGIAPEARFASWVIFRTNGAFVDGTRLASMFEFHNNDVQVQNHSWLKRSLRLTEMSAAEDAAISNAVRNGRGGRGVIMVRAAGNDRLDGRNANEDAYTADPRAITVAAIRADGVVASYSTPGASILISAPGGDFDGSLMTTDRVGSKGFNGISFTNDLADYVFSGLGFTGTSAAAPLVSGITALMLSANTNLTVRDVQHLLVQSAFRSHPTDPDMQTNGAGLPINHNVGYGLVNAGTAVDLARRWEPVPAAIRITNEVSRTNSIQDAGLQVLITSASTVPTNLQSIAALPSLGIHASESAGVFPLVYVGRAIEPITNDLAGKAALIQRGGGDFELKIRNAANAGAELAIIFNNQGTNTLQVMGGTDFVTIPAVFISQMHGEALSALATNSATSAQISFSTTDYEFNVTESLICEHVTVRLDVEHELRGDLRVTLDSPMGTRSVLQRLGPDSAPVNGRWTYLSTHHFYESPVGTWKLSVSDESENGTGTVRSASIEISGIPIKDTDADGLDDDWEQARLGNLASGSTSDPDADGYNNAREQIQGTDPRVNESTLQVDLSAWDPTYVRLNWPSQSGTVYEVLGATDLSQPFTVVATVNGGFPRTAWFGQVEHPYRFFTVRVKGL